MGYIMFGFIQSIILWVVKVKTSPVVAMIAKAVVNVLSQVPPEVPERILALVVEAAGRNEDNRAKFLFVLNRVKAEYPTLPESLVRSTIENALLVYKGQS
jgi:ABC-type amino acid transport system permease subunit